MSNIVPILQMLNLGMMATPADVLDAIRKLQQQVDVQTRRANAMEEAWNTERARAKRAEDPNNWRAVWTGDTATDDIETTALNHGNLVELAGVGQVFMTFRPCCQNLRCECTQRRISGGYCVCHENDE